MSFIQNLKRILGRKEAKVMIPMFSEAKWTEGHRARLNEFMKSATGKALVEQMNMDLYFSQAQACVPSVVNAAERCAIAHGKQQFISKFMSLYHVDQKEPEFMMSDRDLDEVLQQRINGYFPEEVQL